MSTEVLIDHFFLFSLKLSGNILDVYSGEQGISSVNMGLTNASCSRSLSMKKEIAGNVFIVLSFCSQLYKKGITYITKLNKNLKVFNKFVS